MIIDKIEDGLPISVIVANYPNVQRQKFFDEHVLPMIEVNEPNEIIICNDKVSSQKNRNRGILKASNEFIFVMDNDVVLPANYLQNLLECLRNNPNASYCYTGYIGIVLTNESEIKGNFVIETIPFDKARLRSLNNYISTMSLVRRIDHPLFDERLERFQDLDVYLTMLKKGLVGVSYPNQKFIAYFIDKGISNYSNSKAMALSKLLTKHKL